jgi:hypothetical protein
MTRLTTDFRFMSRASWAIISITYLLRWRTAHSITERQPALAVFNSRHKDDNANLKLNYINWHLRRWHLLKRDDDVRNRLFSWLYR